MLSLVPAAVSLIVALLTRKVILSLFFGTLLGSFLISRSVDGAIKWLAVDGIFGQVSQSGNYQLLIVMILISGFVGVIEGSGIAENFGTWIVSKVKSPQSSQIAAWIAGLIIFFTDSGNSLILGPVFRPVFDRQGISRQKLAYILDSTSAPVCVLIPFIGWGVFIMSLLQQNHPDVGVSVTPLEAWIKTFPFQFYPFLALLLVPIAVLTKLRLGGMPEERKDENLSSSQQVSLEFITVLPIASLFICMLICFGYFVFFQGMLGGSGVRASLFIAYSFSTFLFVLVLLKERRLGFREIARSYIGGVRRVSPILVMIILAWTLSQVCKDLETGKTLTAFLGGWLRPAFLPVAVFLTGAILSFATGSSWGTFAILMPVALPLALSMGAHPWLVAGAVLSGGIFGDHCSPVSDTTLLASLGAQCVHQEHVSTQLPYAIIAALMAAMCFLVFGILL